MHKTPLRMRLAAAISSGILLAGVPAGAMVASAASTTQGGSNQAAGQANFGNLISALNNVSAQVSNIQALNNVTVQDVRLVNVQDVLNGNNVQALNNALNANNVQILQNFLNNSVNNNTVVLRNILSSNNLDVSRVVAVDVLSGGQIVVFYQ